MPEVSDKLELTTITSTSITPEQVEAEAKRFAMRTGGILLMAMAERGTTEDGLAASLQVNKRQIRSQLMGEAWRAYLPLAALCLALGIKLDLRMSREL
jgi:hypothetical protein